MRRETAASAIRFTAPLVLLTGVLLFVLTAEGALLHRDFHVPSSLRVMVFSPHPDDETLAAGGLVQRVVERGGEVRIVWITHGDGYAEALQRRLKRSEVSSREFIDYGIMRHKESLEALRNLGLRSRDGIFLGFPDDGIHQLWSAHWSRLNPYRSPHTQLDHAFYQHSPNRWAKYSGESLNLQIKKTLADFSPDWVVIPDPRDIHPDHRATGLFVLKALSELNESGQLSALQTAVFTYLVHYMDYPVASQWEKRVVQCAEEWAMDPAALCQCRWMTLKLSANEQEGKRRALYSHKSQFDVLGDFLKQFLHEREIFCRIDSGHLEALLREVDKPRRRSGT